jgi:hypothetical protein
MYSCIKVCVNIFKMSIYQFPIYFVITIIIDQLPDTNMYIINPKNPLPSSCVNYSSVHNGRAGGKMKYKELKIKSLYKYWQSNV